MDAINELQLLGAIMYLIFGTPYVRLVVASLESQY